jgi:hypothetical protein
MTDTTAALTRHLLKSITKHTDAAKARGSAHVRLDVDDVTTLVALVVEADVAAATAGRRRLGQDDGKVPS